MSKRQKEAGHIQGDYVIRSWLRRFSGKWVVLDSQGRLCTEGNLWWCLDWVARARGRAAPRIVRRPHYSKYLEDFRRAIEHGRTET